MCGQNRSWEAIWWKGEEFRANGRSCVFPERLATLSLCQLPLVRIKADHTCSPSAVP